MAGTYIEGQSKTLSGVYSLVKGILASVTAGPIGIVAYPFTADWGPINALKPYGNSKEFKDVYNAVNANRTAKLIYDLAFPGKPAKVLGYRTATAAAAKGTVIINDAAATPVKSLELETLYPSARAFTAVVKDGLTAGAKIVQITESGVLLVEVEDTTLDGLETKLNASLYVRVKSKGTTMPANNAGAAFAGGNDGEAVTSTQYSAFLTEVEADRTFNGLALDGVTDEAILTVAQDWLKRVRTEGLYGDLYRGGPTGWDSDLSLANTVSAARNHRGIINVGNGVDGYTSAQMAVFVAAYASSRPLNTSVTDQVVPFDAVNVKTPLTKANRELAKEKGTLLFLSQGDKVVIDEGVNTLTSPTVEGEVKAMGKMRLSRIIDHINRSLEALGNEYKKTQSNTTEARQAYAALVEDTFFRPLARQNIVQLGYSYIEDPAFHGEGATSTPALDEAYFYSEYQPVDSMEKIYQKFGVKF
jgi:hypothetical protein